MDQDEKNIDLIDAYARGELKGVELSEFENRRLHDLEFDKEVKDYLLIIKGVRWSQEEAFANKLKDWEDEIDQTGNAGKVIPIKRIFYIAATVLVVAVAGGYFFWSVHNNDELFDQYFQPYADVISSRSDSQDICEQAMGFYNQKEYDKAIGYLSKCIEERPGDLAAQCYLGIAYLAKDRPRDAKVTFKKIVRSEPGLFKEVAEWNLALTHLKLNETDSTKAKLQEIAKQKNHVFSETAHELLLKIPG